MTASPPADPNPVRAPGDFLVFGAPQIGEAEIDEVIASMRSAWLGTGPKVARFEDAFRLYKGAAHAVAVNSCTAALHLSLLAAGIGPGDEVLVPALTFAATVNVVIHSGATPVIVDVEADTMNLDLDAAEAAVTPRTRAILPVHFAGRPVDMDRVMALAGQHGLRVIEDCAHAIETEWHGQTAGTFGDFGCFSFYATKNLTTGEGGMIVTPSEEAAGRLKVLALHGMSKDAWRRFSDEGYRHYQVVEAGFKYNMMDLQAAIGLHQLERIEANWERRRAIWQHYQLELADSGLRLPVDPAAATRHAHHLYAVLVDEEDFGMSRDSFLAAMTAHGIGVGVHYQAIPEHPFYRERFGWVPEMVPQATMIGRQTVSLPISARLSDGDIDDVVEAVHRIHG